MSNIAKIPTLPTLAVLLLAIGCSDPEPTELEPDAALPACQATAARLESCKRACSAPSGAPSYLGQLCAGQVDATACEAECAAGEPSVGWCP